MRSITIDLDLKMFGLASSKELLNQAALIVSQRCIELKADLMTFASIKENKQNWYAFEFAKERIDSYTYSSKIERLVDMPSNFLQSWKEAAKECGELLGNNGVVFFMFVIHYSDGMIKPLAIYSCPKGFDFQYSSYLEAAWGREFVKPLSNPVYLIGKELVPYELYHEPNYYDIDFSKYENDTDYEKNEKITTSAITRYKKAEKKKHEMLKTADPKKRQGYYLVTDEKPETIPY